MPGQVEKGAGETAQVPLSDTERAELAALRAEVTTLRVEAAGGGSGAGKAPRRRHDRHWVRWTASVIVIALAALLSIGAVSARYVRAQLLDTDHYIATVGPLGADPAVQDAVSTKVTAAIEQQLDLEALTKQALTSLTENTNAPDVLVGLAPVIANQANGFIENRVSGFVHSTKFENLWITANTAAHKNLVAVLTGGQGTALTANADGEVSVNLAPIIEAVKQQLTAQGLNFVANLPTVDATFVVFRSPDIAALQRWVNFFNHAATWLLWIAIALVVVGVGIAPRGSRRRATVIAGSLVTLAMLLLGLGISIGRAVYLGAVPSDVLPPTAASTIFDTVIQPLRAGLRAVLVVALIVALAAFLVGPSPAAVGLRRGFMKLVDLASGGRAGATAREPKTWEIWIARFRVAATIAIIGLAALAIAFWHYPSGAVVFWIALIAVVLVIAVQVLAAPARNHVRAEKAAGVEVSAVRAEAPGVPVDETDADTDADTDASSEDEHPASV